MCRKFILTFLTFALLSPIMAQLPDGATAPNITVTDINGNPFSLYSQTSANRGVVLDFFATWCGPCWSFHNSGTLTQVHNNLGAVASVIALEADTRTNTGCIINSGCNYSTLGNWATVPYQIADLNAGNGPTVASQYQINYYPTLYVVSHDNRAYELRSKSYVILRSWLEESFFLDANPVTGHASCGGDGFIDLNRVKGYGSISYNWSNGETTEDLNNLNAGTYSVTVEDQNGYTKQFGPFVINGPSQPLELELQFQTDVSCAGLSDGSATVGATGGNSGYSYQWSNGASGPTASGLAAGPYRVTVVDAQGCTTEESVLITEPAILQAGGNATSEECGMANGQVFVNANGGSRPYTYDIGNGPTTNPTFTGLTSGHYTIEVKDRNDCITYYDATVGSINGPDAFAGVDLTMDCSQPTLQIDGSGSQGPDISYSWTTQDGHIVDGENQLDVEVDMPGTYVLEVVDEVTGCSKKDTVWIADGRSYPQAIFSDVDTLTCANESVWLEVEQQNNASILWSTDDGVFLSNEDSMAVEVEESAWYYITLEDTISRCVTVDSSFVEVDRMEPDYEVMGPESQNCPDIELMLSVADLDPMRTYELYWSTIDGNILGAADGRQLTLDAPGTYTVHVRDVQNGCETFQDWQIANEWNVAVSEFRATPDALDVHFEDHSEGEGLTWFWEFGDDKTSSDQDPVHTYEMEGDYEVCLSVTSECGTDKSCQTITVSEERAPFQIADADLKHVDCFGDSDGRIELSIVGGYPPYEIVWSNGGDQEVIDDLAAGDYSVELRDNQGQTIDQTYTITEPDQLTVQNVSIANDNGQKTGSIELQLEGGIGAYSFLWSDGQTSNPAMDLEAGDYTCEVTDENGCVETFGPWTVEMITSNRDLATEELNVYPNPGNDVIFVEMREVVEVRAVNMTGKTFLLDAHSGGFDVSSLPFGTYWISALNEQGEHQVSRWIKM